MGSTSHAAHRRRHIDLCRTASCHCR
ncbi:putative leader peptide [Rhodococcus sp. NPDC057135]